MKIIDSLNNRFRPEEVIFGSLVILTILVNYPSPVPGMAACCLLAFYYLFFSWSMFTTEHENHVLFSILSGIVYSVCLISITILIGELVSGFVFLYLQLVLLLFISSFLFMKKEWGLYKGNHFIRIGLILFLNFYILVFR